MDFIQAALLGLIQGLTEFLPVSSSGHLVITQKLFGLNPPEEFFFNICVHLGSLIAVLLFFKDEVKELGSTSIRLVRQLAHPKGFPSLFQSSLHCRTLLFLLIATFVTGAVGFLFHSYFVESFSSVKRIGVSWLITAGLLLSAQWKLKQPSSNLVMTWPMAILIGFFQALALFPGISRSGATLTAALLCGLNKERAFRFAFLLFIPTILLVFFVEGIQYRENFIHPEMWSTYLIGFTVSGFCSYLALHILRWFVSRQQLLPFVFYCFIIGLLALLFF